MRILLIQHLNFLNGTGGTEKICCLLANYFASEGHESIIATNQALDGIAMFELNKHVVVQNIYNPSVVQFLEQPIYNYKGKNLLSWLKFKIKKKIAKFHNARLTRSMGGKEKLFLANLKNRALHWKRYIQQVSPDLIITMSTSSLLEITYQNRISAPIINSVNGRPDYDFSDIFGARPDFLKNLLIQSYRHLSGIQVLFESYKKYLPETFKGIVQVISNPVVQMDSKQIVDHLQIKDEYTIIHIGRLDTYCKQQHLAIEAFASLAEKFPNWKMEFWGEGNDYQILNKQILSLGLVDRIFLRGFTNDPTNALKLADIFIFPSLFEGFPLSILEAMSVGLPSIGFKHCSGVNELIEHGETGFLANDLDEMKNFLSQLMLNPKIRQRMGVKANIAVGIYNHKQTIDSWHELGTKVINNYSVLNV